MSTFETLLHEAWKPLWIICFEPVTHSVWNCQSHVISVNEASLRHNGFQMFQSFSGSAHRGNGLCEPNNQRLWYLPDLGSILKFVDIFKSDICIIKKKEL